MTQEYPIRMQHPGLPGQSLNSGYAAMRLPDGGVVLEQRKSNGHVMTTVSRQVFSAEQWATLVAAMGPEGLLVCESARAYEDGLVARHHAISKASNDADRATIAAAIPEPSFEPTSMPAVAATLAHHLGR